VASRQIRTIILCLFAVFAFSAVAANTASAHRVWTVCKEVPGEGKEPPPKFDNHLCETKAKPLPERKWEDVVLPVGTKVPIEVVKVVKPFELKAGTTIITCEEVVLKEGTIENILVGGNGPTGRDHGTIEFKKCKTSISNCTVKEPIIDKGKESALVENTAGTKIYDMFAPEGWHEEATRALAEKIRPYAKIEQTGTGTGCINTEVEGNGVAAEIVPEFNSEKKMLKFPCEPTLTPVNFWNGVKEVPLTLKAFVKKAEECGEIELALVGRPSWGVE
jgi:hypothetical protein